MEYKIIVDSCCDLTQELKESSDIKAIPLTMRLGSKAFIDDASLCLKSFMAQMTMCTEKVGSASPAPILYQEAVDSEKTNFIVTLSEKLSGSYASAVLAKKLAEESGDRDIHVFNSKSASAGETLIILKLKEFIAAGLSKSQIIQKTQKFIDEMKTYFVLDNYDNLLKNGRLSRVQGALIQILNIKLIMGADGDGNIALFKKARGIKQMITNLMDMISNSGKKTDSETLVISHCNNQSMAQQLREEIKCRFNFKNILIVATGGLSSMYADNKGIVMAF